jgi:hypothetical protein
MHKKPRDSTYQPPFQDTVNSVEVELRSVLHFRSCVAVLQNQLGLCAAPGRVFYSATADFAIHLKRRTVVRREFGRPVSYVRLVPGS